MNIRFYILLAINVVFGIWGTIWIKAMYMTSVDGEYFTHAQFITASLFLGETLVIFVYMLGKTKQNVSWKQFGIFIGFAVIDIIAMQLTFLGVIMTAISIREMLQGLNIVYTALFTMWLVKNRRRFTKQKVLGLVLIVTGVTLVGLSSLLFVQASNAAKNPTIGLILIMIGQVIRSLQITLEEIWVANFDPYLAVAIEGGTGFIIVCLIMLISQFIPCNDENFCYNGKFEDTALAFQQLSQSPKLIGLWLLYIVCCLAVNSTGMAVTQSAGAVTRTTTYPMRQAFVWAISLALGWEEWIWLEFIGFLVFLIPGILIYNEVFSIKCLKSKSELTNPLL